ncbi:cyclic nucleotide-binding domain-containing protein [Candidatus Latescibacterota bacterium]
MDENSQRSGFDRREQQEKIEPEKRKSMNRRNVFKDYKFIINTLEKFPIFKGLTSYQYQQILSICSKKTFNKGQYVCQEADESNEMYILLSGQLQVMFQKKTVLTIISPMSLVGELVFFTGEQGFSSVIATTESTVISIHKEELFSLLKRDSALSFTILMNVISELSHKLRKDDEIISDLKKK